MYPILLGLTLLLPLVARGGLTADEVVVLCNADDEESVELARYYAQQRGIPAANILAVPLPRGERISFETYHNDILPRLRTVLVENGFHQSARCLVTVSGVPLTISHRKPGDNEDEELRQLTRLREQATGDLQQIATDAEALAVAAGAEADDVAVPRDPARALARLQAAGRALQEFGPALEAARRQELGRAWQAISARLRAPVTPEGWELVTPDAAAVQAANLRPADAEARQIMRDAGRASGPVTLLAILSRQQNLLTGPETGASFESELAVILWPNYALSRWQMNPLNFRYNGPNAPKTFMTARLDARDADTVRRMIDDGLAAERDGVPGRFVVDSRGIDAVKDDGSIDAYGAYDESLRQLANVLQRHIPNRLVFDEAGGVIGENTVAGIAGYAGWYSVKNYVRPGTFTPGAVAFHIASFELVQMKNPNFTGWVPNLLADGAAATLGPVAEPYLASFPKAHDFFLLLLSDRMTLGEAYWVTNPMVSWQVTLVGDPLARPYSVRPPLRVDQLPPHLREVEPPRQNLGENGERPQSPTVDATDDL